MISEPRPSNLVRNVAILVIALVVVAAFFAVAFFYFWGASFSRSSTTGGSSGNNLTITGNDLVQTCPVETDSSVNIS